MSLPITPFLDDICQNLKNSSSRFLILTAETAAGKSTAVPPALLKAFPKKILMLEPRRLAVLSIASRIAETLGENTGITVGYRMHLENRCSKDTRLEIITEAILTRRLQNDPELSDVSVVVIDEFHERSIHADLALAFLKEAMLLRDDLYVIVMSATIETKKLSEYLGSEAKPAPVMKIPGRQFPVNVEYAGNLSPAKAVVQQLALSKEPETMLVFLPGIADIRRTQNELAEYNISEDEAEILCLHSSISFAEQQKVLAPQPDHHRVILSSAIAETSLTVPGVRTVIDSGLARVNKMNITLGMEHLVTETESIFSAEQRAGRAGRLGPGKCIRLWNKNDVLVQANQPEILRSDITTLVLECAQWGVSDYTKLNWLDEPNPAAWNEARNLLNQIGCLAGNSITPLGKACLKLGLHPRLSCVALSGHIQACVDFSNYARSSAEIQKRFTKDLQERISQLEKNLVPAAKNEAVALLAGFPDRIARKTDDSGLYQFPSGRVAHLKKEDACRHATLPLWIVAPEVDAGRSEGTIYSYSELKDEDALEWLKDRTETKNISSFDNNKIKKSQIVCFGKIILSTKQLVATAEDFAQAICGSVEENGLSTLPLDEKTKELIVREQFFAQQSGSEPKSLEEKLCCSVQEWLLPFLSGKTKVDSETVWNALYWYLDGAELDQKAPVQLTLPNGKKRKISYEKQSTREDKTTLVIRPVLEIIIQQIFGCFETPKVMGMPVLLKLLSPARRPLQITDDLANFWTSTWPEICKEMKGRYPKHNWDYKVAEKD